MEFFSESVVEPWMPPPVLAPLDVLLAIVTLVRFAGPPTLLTPPPDEAVLPLKVLFVIVDGVPVASFR
jgi:hypothetical protein